MPNLRRLRDLVENVISEYADDERGGVAAWGEPRARGNNEVHVDARLGDGRTVHGRAGEYDGISGTYLADPERESGARPW